MKRVLVIGASGMVGQMVIKYLLTEGKYEITALDVKNKKVFNFFTKYRKRLNIIYGDVLDRTLIESFIKENDYVIYLASVLPPFADLKKDISKLTEEDGIENVVRAINFYNKKCKLIYASSTSVYGENTSVNAKLATSESNFNNSKINAERFITKNALNYTILRLPLIMGDLRYDPMIYNIPKDEIVEVITKEDAAYAFVMAIKKFNVVNHKIYNIGGGVNCQIRFNELCQKILKYHGISFKMLNTKLFIQKTYHSKVLNDTIESNKVLTYQNDSIQSYMMRQKRRSNKRKISKALAKVFLKLYK